MIEENQEKERGNAEPEEGQKIENAHMRAFESEEY